MTEENASSRSADVDMIRAILAEKNINQKDLADHIKTSRVAVNQVLNGKRSVTPIMALKLEAALGIPARSLLLQQSIVDLDRVYGENSAELERISNNPLYTPQIKAS